MSYSIKRKALVHFLAHELRHLWQKNHPKKKDKVLGSRDQFSDRGADAYAFRKMREWRHQDNNNIAGLGSWLYYNGCYYAGERACEGHILVRN